MRVVDIDRFSIFRPRVVRNLFRPSCNSTQTTHAVHAKSDCDGNHVLVKVINSSTRKTQQLLMYKRSRELLTDELRRIHIPEHYNNSVGTVASSCKW